MKQQVTLKSLQDLSTELLKYPESHSISQGSHEGWRFSVPIPTASRVPRALLPAPDSYSSPSALASHLLVSSLARTYGSLALAEPKPALDIPPRRRILLAEDSPFIRESLAKLLRQESYDVTEAANGLEALRLLEAESFDLVLLDLSMPEMDGWEMLTKLKHQLTALPIIVITGHHNQRDWIKGIGARALLEKPIDPAILLQTIHDLLGDGPHVTDWQLDYNASHFRWHPNPSSNRAVPSGLNE